MIPMHTDRPNLDESCHCPQSRPAALIRVLDIEPAVEATHGFHATSLACHDSPCTVSGCLFVRLTPSSLANLAMPLSAVGHRHRRMYSASQQQSSTNVAFSFALSVTSPQRPPA